MRRVPSVRGLSLAPLVLLSLAAAQGAWADTGAGCLATRTAEVQASRSLKGSPVADELSAPSAQLGAGVGFARLYDDAVSVDLVLSRIRHQDCVARLPQQPSAGALANSGAAYQPGQQADGQAWRFNMTQNGKRMTADEFDAWMKSRGVRVVPARAEAPAAAPAPAPAEPAPAKKKR